ncbi:MAG: 8-oxoguanine DNA glycosylase [Clostridia bacterium]|nr:8-oxoguanine DNA glycosylase [Clostridia bacterium]
MIIEEGKGSITLKEVRDFELKHIFECGQCFRWDVIDDGSYIGIAASKAIKISETDDGITIYNTTKDEFTDFWQNYFDLDFDYGKLKRTLSKDRVLKTAIKSGEGIRILNQDLWECIISFIISANNNIPRIKGIIKTFCELFGEKVILGEDVLYSFPSPERLSTITVDDLKPLRAGYRDKYIIDAIEKVSNGIVSLEVIKEKDYDEAKGELLKIKGVGNKVADCILLFGAGKKEAFPVDVWIKRVIDTLYKDELGEKDISVFAKEKFGKFGGYAQQYLFYHMRENHNKGM